MRDSLGSAKAQPASKGLRARPVQRERREQLVMLVRPEPLELRACLVFPERSALRVRPERRVQPGPWELRERLGPALLSLLHILCGPHPFSILLPFTLAKRKAISMVSVFSPSSVLIRIAPVATRTSLGISQEPRVQPGSRARPERPEPWVRRGRLEPQALRARLGLRVPKAHPVPKALKVPKALLGRQELPALPVTTPSPFVPASPLLAEGARSNRRRVRSRQQQWLRPGNARRGRQ
jgi:hypothetical protein